MTADDQTTDRLVKIVVVVFFLKAAGFVLLFLAAPVRSAPTRSLVVALVLAAALAGTAVGLLNRKRWAWPVALAVLLFDAMLVESVLRWLIDLGLALVLIQPRVRAGFGMR